MKTIKTFIEDFTNTEYNANNAKWNLNMTDSEAIGLGELPRKYLHSILSHISFGRSQGLFEDEDFKDFAPIKLNRVVHRILFQIKKYENPTCGDVIKRILKENIIYLCYTSRDEQIDDNPLGYNNVYVVAETNEGLKIIDIILYHKGKVFITNDKDTSEVEHFGIKEYGKLMEVKKYQAPEEESSLKEYNAHN